MLAVMLTAPAYAITDSEVQAQVDAVGKEAVTGNVLVWFLCAVGFLKVSQKIDSFMASLGVNVGHTGGSMLSEAMIAAKSISMVAGAAGHKIGGFGKGGGSSGASGSPGTAGSSGFLKGGLAGVVSRKITSDAMKTATSSTSATAAHTATGSHTASGSDTHTVSGSATHTATATDAPQAQTSQTATTTRTDTSAQAATMTQSSQASSAAKQSSTAQHTSAATASASKTASHTATQRHTSLGGAIFANSLRSGGQFANDVIGQVARGDIRSTGSITGDMASQALQSYMGYTALGSGATDVSAFSGVEIGGGRITGTEVSPEHPEGIAFGMYSAAQYAAPEGAYSKVSSADGAQWYRQYAADAVEKKPFAAPDGQVAYHESIVKKLPNAPKRKDRM